MLPGSADQRWPRWAKIVAPMSFTPMQPNLRANMSANLQGSTQCSERLACTALCEPRLALLCPEKACTLSRFAPICRHRDLTHPCIALRLARIQKRRDERTQRMAVRPNAPRQKVRPAFAKATPSRELCAALPTCLLPCPACHASPCRYAPSRAMNLHPRRPSTCRDPVPDSTFTSRGTSMR